jgi:hypothetical protein
MLTEGISRRAFLENTGKATALTYASIATAGLGGFLRPGEAHGAPWKSLSEDQARSMLAVTRRLFPHDELGDRYYWVAVNGIDAEMASSADLEGRIKDGLGQLDRAFGVTFAELSEGNQIKAMKTVESAPFFSDMLGKTNFYFYNNKNVWRHFGYEGSSYEFGGYLERGFDDIGWLR